MQQRHDNLEIKIREIMTREVSTLCSTANAEDAAKIMHQKDVGMLPVMDDGQVVGLITDRDLVLRILAEGRDSRQTPIRDIMTTEIFYCYEDEDVAEAIDSMEAKQIRRLVILNRDKQLAGVLSIGDLAVDTGNRNLAGELLQKVSEPAKVDEDFIPREKT